MIVFEVFTSVEYCSYKGLTPFYSNESLFLSMVEYCSYKGLTPSAPKILPNLKYVEYCSYKGLTLVIIDTSINGSKELNIVLIKD
mgnify:CR=1 FL=1